MKKVKKPVILENVKVVDMGAKGKNVAKTDDNYTIFVEKAVPGDIIDIQLYKKKTSYGEGYVLGWKEYSKERVQPVCSHFVHCGGCSWQNLNYAAQLKFKHNIVYNALKRIGKLETPEFEPILGSPYTEYYRNKLDFSFSNKRWLTFEEMGQEFDPLANPALGFHIAGKFDKILDIKRCYLQRDPSNQIRLSVKEFAIANQYSFFDPRAQVGFMRGITIRTTASGEIMVIVIFFSQDTEKIETMMKFLIGRFPDITSLYYVVNPKANDTTWDLEHHLWHGTAYIREKVGELFFRLGPKSFFQTNPFQAAQLFGKTKEFAGLTGSEIVYDLYTGVGSIALFIADRVKKVIGIETVPEAIEFAKLNAIDNNITNADFYVGDVKDVFNDAFISENGHPDVIITDPPRTGMDVPVTQKILELKPKKIVYVSCNPSTQARDLEMFSSDYTITKVQPVDMFPHTYHVENIVLLERKY